MNTANPESIRLLRDVDAYMVPSGDEVKLLAGNLVKITQALGGNYTVIMNGNMVQIRAENADALGIEVKEQKKTEPSGDIEKQVWDQLKTCYDPEIPVNIYDLGLIYDVKVDDKNNVDVKMTLTTPNCPVAESLPMEVENTVKEVKEVNKVNLELVWDPPWDKSMITEAGKLELNL